MNCSGRCFDSLSTCALVKACGFTTASVLVSRHNHYIFMRSSCIHMEVINKYLKYHAQNSLKVLISDLIDQLLITMVIRKVYLPDAYQLLPCDRIHMAAKIRGIFPGPPGRT